MTTNSLNIVEAEVVGHVIDYNNGILIPFTPITDTQAIYNRLRQRATYCIDLDKRAEEEKEEEKIDPEHFDHYMQSSNWRSERRSRWYGGVSSLKSFSF